MLSRETQIQLSGFSFIGLINTGIHLVVIYVLVEFLYFYPVSANGIAFMCANIFSFFANSRWTFRVSLSFRRYIRFLMVSLFGFCFSISASALVDTLHWHYLLGVFISFIFLPFITFISQKKITWKIN